ncbi:MAG: hypothetical protein GY772_04585, partial [bacterium]|nr:hypothetical protein [bacterium]
MHRLAQLADKTVPASLRDELHNAIRHLTDVKPAPGVIEQISLCTTSFRRNHQVKQCLPANVLFAWAFPVRLYFCDFNEDSELRDWILENLEVALDSEKLVFISGRLPRDQWHASIAKNTIHECAATFVKDNTILVNLDSDNLATRRFYEHLLEWGPWSLLTNSEGALHYHA